MSLMKRLSATVTASLDQLVGEIENHDAVVEATLRDMQKKIAQAKVRLQRVNQEKQRLQQQVSDLQADAATWRKRAVQTAQSNETESEQTALACLERARSHDQQVAAISATLDQYQATSDKLSHDVSRAEQQLGEVKQKQVLMRARQSTSQAVSATNRASNDELKTLDETFDRWEINILETEIGQDDIVDTRLVASDELEQAFVTEEQRQALTEELAQLIREEQDRD